MLKQCATILITGVICSSLFAKDLTSVQKADLTKTAALIQNQCSQGLKEKVKQRSPTNENTPALVRLLSTFTDSDNYCTCTTNAFQQNMTSEQYTRLTEDALKEYLLRAGRGCAIKIMKANLPNFCGDMFNDIAHVADGRLLTREENAVACSCLQEGMSSLNEDNFDAYFRQSMLDYRSYKEFRQIPDGPVSLIKSVKACITYGAQQP